MLSRPPSSVSSPESGSSGVGQPRCPQLAERHVQSVQVGGGHELVHPGRRQPGRRGQGADRDPLGAGRDQRPRPFPFGLPQPPRGTGHPGQDPPLPHGRLDPLADRHPPIVPATFRKLDAVAVLTGPLLPGTLSPLSVPPMPGPSPKPPDGILAGPWPIPKRRSSMPGSSRARADHSARSRPRPAFPRPRCTAISQARPSLPENADSLSPSRPEGQARSGEGSSRRQLSAASTTPRRVPSGVVTSR